MNPNLTALKGLTLFVACKRLYTLLCWLVGWSVCWNFSFKGGEQRRLRGINFSV